MSKESKIKYACAVLLILSSICMVAYQVTVINDVASGLLLYVGQAFLLAASIFGLDYYVQKYFKDNGNNRNNFRQESKPT